MHYWSHLGERKSMSLPNKTSIKGTSIIQSMNKSFSIIAVGLIVFFLLIVSLLFVQQKLESSNEWQYRSVMLALSLKESSAQLTKNARAFVTTKEEIYKTNYWNIIKVRKGEAPSTLLEHNTVYRLATHSLLGSKNDVVAIETWFDTFAFTEKERLLISEAAHESTALVTLEDNAMNHLQTESEQTAAIALLYSATYNDALNKIIVLSDNFIDAVNERTQQERAYYQLLVWIISSLLLLQIIGFSLYLVFYSNTLFQKRLLHPIALLAQASHQIANGNQSSNMPVTQDIEIKQLVASLSKIQQIQQQLDAQNRFTEQVMNQLPVGIMLINEQGMIEFANDKVRETFDNIELLTQPIKNLLPYLDDISNISDIKTLAQTQDTRLFMSEVSSSQIMRNGKAQTLMAINDIQIREKAEQRLKFTEFVVDKSPDIVFWVNTSTGNISYADETAYEVLGYKTDSLLHYPITELDPSIDNWQGLLARLMDEIVMQRESEFLCADGSFLPVEASLFLVSFGGRQTLIISARDIRESRALQTEMQAQVATLQESRRATTNMLLDLEVAKKEVEAIHRHTRESIEYASLIQHALIPDEALFKEAFGDYMTFWRPKDLVGGDIYFFTKLRHDDEMLLMVIDCTGHGVPGAFVTMLVKAIEQQIVANIKFTDEAVSPASILTTFNQTLKFLLKQEKIDSINNAGFDGAVIYYQRQEKIIKFAGAETPLFYTQNDKLLTIKGDRHSVGYKKSDANYVFTEHIIPVELGMRFYLTTDGYLDQNGGNKGFPLGKKRFTQLITEYGHLPFTQQQNQFKQCLTEYQGDEIRNDDVTVIAFTI